MDLYVFVIREETVFIMACRRMNGEKDVSEPMRQVPFRYLLDSVKYSWKCTQYDRKIPAVKI